MVGIRPHGRGHGARAFALALLPALAGCAGPAIRSQSPEIEALASLEEGTKLVGDYTAPWGLSALTASPSARTPRSPPHRNWLTSSSGAV